MIDRAVKGKLAAPFSMSKQRKIIEQPVQAIPGTARFYLEQNGWSLDRVEQVNGHPTAYYRKGSVVMIQNRALDNLFRTMGPTNPNNATDPPQTRLVGVAEEQEWENIDSDPSDGIGSI